MNDDGTPINGDPATPTSTDPNAIPAPSPADAQAAQATGAGSSEELQKQLAAERLARQKVEMERNKLKNEREEAETKRLKEIEDYRALYEKSQTELDSIRQKEETTRLEAFRKDVINSYPDEKVRKAADALIAKNPGAIVWEAGADEEQAKAQLTDQLDALRDAVGTPLEPTEGQPAVEPLNPAPSAATLPKPQASLADIEADLQRRTRGAGL